MKKVAIEFKKVTKSFSWYRENRLKLKLTNWKTSHEEKIVALDKVSFKIREGEVLGLYGPNGSGKSTALRIMASILKPDSGKIEVVGRVMPVIDLGLGLDPELTGEENIFLFSSILGLPEVKVRDNLNKIIKFAGIEKYIKMPMKKYSSGMRARLAFSTALYSEADILLFDEILAVGDLEFKTKCEKAIKKLKGNKTIVVVSHDLEQLYRFCDRMLHFENGKIVQSSSSRMKQFLYSLGEKDEYMIEAMSNSMWPVIAKGDRLVVKKIPFDKLKLGDIVAFSFKNISEIIVHRVAGMDTKSKSRLLTKGDANYSQDNWKITKENYLGKVVEIKS
jgi:ABC-type polysaccharide/polyol phosphate transport system ATPase subunit